MILQSIKIENFRSIKEAVVKIDDLTALVGANGSGKSTILHALRLFYAQPENKSGGVTVTEQDFFNRNISKAIEITCTFKNLRKDEIERFGEYVQEGTLSVTRVMKIDGQSKLHGSKQMHGGFKMIRSATRAADIKSEYETLRTDYPKYSTLPKYSNKDNVEPSLQDWEKMHPEDCVLTRDDGAFFGWGNVGKGKLDISTKFIMIPAVRDATEDASDSARSAISTLLDMVVRKRMRAMEEVKALQEKINDDYHKLIEPTRKELAVLGAELTTTLSNLIPSAEVKLDWNDPKDMSLPLPTADVQVSEDTYLCSLSHVGHGLQRAFIITLLQHLAFHNENANNVEEHIEEPSLPNLILAIEEPELYQHPNRQRHLARVLSKIATGEITGITKRTQIIYTTHSPLMVGLDRFDKLRLLRKKTVEPDQPSATCVLSVTLQEIANKLKELTGAKEEFTTESLRSRLSAIMTPTVNEGFFSDANIIVEGEGDKAAILGVATQIDKDLEGKGISILPAGSKNNIDRLFLIFTSFGIPCYLVWDNDRGKGDDNEQKKSASTNRMLLRLLGETEEDWPVTTCKTHSCLDKNLEVLFKERISNYRELIDMLKDLYGYSKDRDAVKSPFFIAELLNHSAQVGEEIFEVKQIVDFALQMIDSEKK